MAFLRLISSVEHWKWIKTGHAVCLTLACSAHHISASFPCVCFFFILFHSAPFHSIPSLNFQCFHFGWYSQRNVQCVCFHFYLSVAPILWWFFSCFSCCLLMPQQLTFLPAIINKFLHRFLFRSLQYSHSTKVQYVLQWNRMKYATLFIACVLSTTFHFKYPFWDSSLWNEISLNGQMLGEYVHRYIRQRNEFEICVRNNML